MTIARYITPLNEEYGTNVFLLEVEFGEDIRVTADCDITNALKIMFIHKIAMLPVYEGEEIIGVVTMGSLPSS